MIPKMNKLLLILVIVVCSNFSFAGERENAVRNLLNSKYDPFGVLIEDNTNSVFISRSALDQVLKNQSVKEESLIYSHRVIFRDMISKTYITCTAYTSYDPNTKIRSLPLAVSGCKEISKSEFYKAGDNTSSQKNTSQRTQ
jgi:hypothetical protein